jgi:hypothetical protein
VPLPAIQRGAEGTFVFIVSPDKTVNQRAVKLGIQDGEKVAITEGLEPGDTVVVDGADRLRDGAQVSIPDPKTTITAPSAGAGGAARAGGRGQMTPAVLARVAAACGEDTKKYCATPEQLAPPQRAGGAGGNGGGQRAGGGGGFGGGNGGGGGGNAAFTPEQRQQARVVGCLNRNRISLTAQCTAALPAQRARGGAGGGGGGFP